MSLLHTYSKCLRVGLVLTQNQKMVYSTTRGINQLFVRKLKNVFNKMEHQSLPVSHNVVVYRSLMLSSKCNKKNKEESPGFSEWPTEKSNKRDLVQVFDSYGNFKDVMEIKKLEKRAKNSKCNIVNTDLKSDKKEFRDKLKSYMLVPIEEPKPARNTSNKIIQINEQSEVVDLKPKIADALKCLHRGRPVRFEILLNQKFEGQVNDH